MSFTTPRLITLLFFSLILIYYCAISFLVFPGGPVNFDEYGYYNQAKLFSQGKWVEKIDRFHPTLMEHHVRHEGDRYFSKYPPGFTVVLAAFMKLGAEKAANPFIMTVAFFVMFQLLVQFLDRRTSYVIILLAATTPYATGYGSSLFAQPLTLLLVTCCIFYFYNYQQTKQSLTYLSATFFIVLLMLTRPVDAVIITAILAGATILSCGFKRFFFHASTLLLCLLAGYFLLSIYYSILEGEFSLITYSRYQFYQQGMVEPQAANLFNKIELLLRSYSSNAEKYLYQLYTYHFLPLVGHVFISLAAVGVLKSLSNKNYNIFPLSILLVVLIINLFPTMGYPAYGARYWFGFYGCFVVLVALGWHVFLESACCSTTKKVILPIAGVSFILLQAWFNIHQGQNALNNYYNRFTLLDNAQKNMQASCPKKSIVVLLNREGNSSGILIPFVNDSFLKQNTFGNKERLIIRYKTIKNIGAVKAIQDKYPEYNICPHQPDYTNFKK